MESTGTYWQSLFATLQSMGLEVLLCNGKFTKNIKGKKTDVQDCQWIQKLHTLGLLSGSFLPDEATEQLRTYCRHRANLLGQAADTSRKMQKYLRLMNLRLDVVVKDITGLTGLAIIDSICKGESKPESLASLRHGNCKKSEQEIAKALQSNGRKDLLFALTHEYQLYLLFQKKITECDNEINKLLSEQISNDDNKREHHIDKKIHKRINKNTPDININLLSYQYFEGVDLLAHATTFQTSWIIEKRKKGFRFVHAHSLDTVEKFSLRGKFSRINDKGIFENLGHCKDIHLKFGVLGRLCASIHYTVDTKTVDIDVTVEAHRR